MKIYSVSDPEFRPYGKVLTGFDTSALVAAMQTVPMPERGTAYEPAIEALETCGIFDAMQNRAYGGLPIQIGMCWGYNTKLNCLEYHRDSEINVGEQDFILLLAKEDEIEDGQLDTAKVKAFRVPAGTAVEIYGTTLHYAPCQTAKTGFRVAVVLPKGTNTEKPAFEPQSEEDIWMTARNKWLLAHPDSSEAKSGAHIGLTGKNIDITENYRRKGIMFENIPNVKLGLIAVSRDCFPRTLSEMRRANIAKACEGGVYECPVTVENEADMLRAVADVKAADCNALVVFLGNFGPETPETLIARYFDGPCMFVAAAEGDGDLINGRGDAYCGMLNCSYNLGMRHLKGYIPEYPVGTAEDIAKMIADFVPIARAVIGVKNLKIITFGPRPQDFFACNAPIKGLYELGVEIEENSELDLLVSYKAHAGDARIPAVCEDMKQEMGEGKYYADMLERMAQFELTLLDWAEGHKGARKYVAFADKCWPAFPEQFGFEPCYVNSRLASRGIPVACEVDIYGALSEYIGACISKDAVTLLDINNSVPASLFDAEIKGKFDYTLTDTFMGFHCGNTPSCKMCADRAIKYQLIQHRLLEPAGSEPDFTRGTLEADIAASQITFYRLQCDSDGNLRSYIAEGEILPVKTGSFGGIGIFAIPEMGRFYRHVLVQKRYPHHGAVAFGHYGKLLFEVFKFLGVGDIAYNQPKSLPYPTENPFA